MTEAEWLACENPTAMLIAIRERASHRKLRLFACLCCRQNAAFMALSGADRVVAAAERSAEGKSSRSDVAGALQGLAPSLASTEFDRSYGAMELGFCSEDAYIAVTYTVAWATDEEPLTDQRLADQLRDIFGNPFRPVTLDPAWLTSDVLALARGIYDERAFDRMPILADALQDAGCDRAEVLDHCRGGGLSEDGGLLAPRTPHARGCWVVDLVLGKS